MKTKKDIRVEVRIRNNLALSMMEQAGIKNAAELSRSCGVDQSTLGKIFNMQWSPLNKNLQWRKEALQLSDFFKCLPEDLFSETHVQHVLESNRSYAETSFAEMQHLIAAGDSDAFLPENILSGKQCVENIASMLATLTPRQTEVLTLRFGLGGGEELTLEKTGKLLGCSAQRIRQVEGEALQKLRYPSKSERLRIFHETP